MEEIKEVNAKIASKEEAFWTGIKERAEKEIENSKREIIINERIINLAEEKIAEENKPVGVR